MFNVYLRLMFNEILYTLIFELSVYYLLFSSLLAIATLWNAPQVHIFVYKESVFC